MHRTTQDPPSCYVWRHLTLAKTPNTYQHIMNTAIHTSTKHYTLSVLVRELSCGVKREKTIPGTSRKLNLKWTGPFRVVEVIRNGSAYILVNPVTGQRLQRAADKLKVHYGSEEWLLHPRSEEPEEDPDEAVEPLPPRIRRPPRRLITECWAKAKFLYFIILFIYSWLFLFYLIFLYVFRMFFFVFMFERTKKPC